MARPTPKHIDRRARAFEYLVAFGLPFFVLRVWWPMASVFLAAGLCAAYIRLAAGKPDGFMIHAFYRMGLPVRGLLPRAVAKLGR